MYAGKDATTGPVVGFVKFARNAHAAKLVRGNPENAADAIWEDLRRVERWSWSWAGAGVRYRWEMAIINWDRDGDGEVVRKGFLWKRTKAFTVDGASDGGSPGYRGHVRAASMGAMTSKSVERQSYKLVDEETGELLAVFSVDVGMGRFRRLGRMRFVTEKYGLAFKMMVFLSGLVVNSWEDL